MHSVHQLSVSFCTRTCAQIAALQCNREMITSARSRLQLLLGPQMFGIIFINEFVTLMTLLQAYSTFITGVHHRPGCYLTALFLWAISSLICCIHDLILITESDVRSSISSIDSPRTVIAILSAKDYFSSWRKP